MRISKQFGIFLLLFMGCSVVSYSQASSVDSLKSALINMPIDTNKVNALLDLSTQTFRTQPDTAIVYAQKAIELSNSLNYKRGEGYALKNIGLAYYVKSDFSEVLNYWLRSLETFESIDDKLGISNLNNNIGAVYFNYADYSNALAYYLESLKAAELLGDKLRIATALMNIGAVYYEKPATHDKALSYYQRAIPICEEIGNLDAIGTSTVNLGEIYMTRMDYDSALLYFEKALFALEESGGNAAFVLSNMGKVYAKQGKFSKAIAFHKRAIKSAQQKNSKHQLVQAYIGLGDTYLQQEAWRSAQEKYKEAERIAEEIGLKSELESIYSGLADSYAGQKDHLKAYAYQTLFSKIKDTLYNIESDRKLSNIQFQFDLEKKETQIELLQKENDLSEARVKQANLFRNSMIAFAILLFFILVGIYYQYRFAKRSNKIISEERNRAESILLNILPEETAQELKEKGSVQAKKYDTTTVMFTDFKQFTRISEGTSPENLVRSINYFFTAFDEIVSRHELEKIKTIGDSYMCVGGLPVPDTSNPINAVHAAKEIIAFVEEVKQSRPEGIIPFEIRVGINTGPVVAGVVGTKKFQYDIWGSTVNLASILETTSTPGRINISETTYAHVKDAFPCTFRGEIEGKNGKRMHMYFVD